MVLVRNVTVLEKFWIGHLIDQTTCGKSTIWAAMTNAERDIVRTGIRMASTEGAPNYVERQEDVAEPTDTSRTSAI